MSHQLLDSLWPRLLTPELDDLLPWDTVSFAASIDVVAGIIGFVVAVRTWQVDPFDFSDDTRRWWWLVRTVLVVALVGTVAGTIAALVEPAGRGELDGAPGTE